MQMVKVYGKITVIKRDGEDGSYFPVSEKCAIGRSKESDIRLQVPAVSDNQCMIYVKNGQVCLQNLSDSSPTLLNSGRFMDGVALKHGDIIKINDRCFRFDVVRRSSSSSVSSRLKNNSSHSTVQNKPFSITRRSRSLSPKVNIAPLSRENCENVDDKTVAVRHTPGRVTAAKPPSHTRCSATVFAVATSSKPLATRPTPTASASKGFGSGSAPKPSGSSQVRGQKAGLVSPLVSVKLNLGVQQSPQNNSGPRAFFRTGVTTVASPSPITTNTSFKASPMPNFPPPKITPRGLKQTPKAKPSPSPQLKVNASPTVVKDRSTPAIVSPFTGKAKTPLSNVRENGNVARRFSPHVRSISTQVQRVVSSFAPTGTPLAAAQTPSANQPEAAEIELDEQVTTANFGTPVCYAAQDDTAPLLLQLGGVTAAPAANSDLDNTSEFSTASSTLFSSQDVNLISFSEQRGDSTGADGKAEANKSCSSQSPASVKGRNSFVRTRKSTGTVRVTTSKTKRSHSLSPLSKPKRSQEGCRRRSFESADFTKIATEADTSQPPSVHKKRKSGKLTAETETTAELPQTPEIRVKTDRKYRGSTKAIRSARKSVTFGFPLSPELFDGNLPPSTPIRKGAQPPLGSTPFAQKPALKVNSVRYSVGKKKSEKYAMLNENEAESPANTLIAQIQQGPSTSAHNSANSNKSSELASPIADRHELSPKSLLYEEKSDSSASDNEENCETFARKLTRSSSVKFGRLNSSSENMMCGTPPAIKVIMEKYKRKSFLSNIVGRISNEAENPTNCSEVASARSLRYAKKTDTSAPDNESFEKAATKIIRRSSSGRPASSSNRLSSSSKGVMRRTPLAVKGIMEKYRRKSFLSKIGGGISKHPRIYDLQEAAANSSRMSLLEPACKSLPTRTTNRLRQKTPVRARKSPRKSSIRSPLVHTSNLTNTSFTSISAPETPDEAAVSPWNSSPDNSQLKSPFETSQRKSTRLSRADFEQTRSVPQSSVDRDGQDKYKSPFETSKIKLTRPSLSEIEQTFKTVPQESVDSCEDQFKSSNQSIIDEMLDEVFEEESSNLEKEKLMVSGISELFKTPRRQSEQILASVCELVRTPKPQTEAILNSLQKLLDHEEAAEPNNSLHLRAEKTLPEEKSSHNRSTRYSDIQRMLKTPKARRSAVNTPSLDCLFESPVLTSAQKMQATSASSCRKRAAKSDADACSSSDAELLDDTSPTKFQKKESADFSELPEPDSGCEASAPSSEPTNSESLNASTVIETASETLDCSLTEAFEGTHEKVQQVILTGIRELLKTPKAQSDIIFAGIRDLVRTPKQQAETILTGLKRLLNQKSASANCLEPGMLPRLFAAAEDSAPTKKQTRYSGIQGLLKSPRRQKATMSSPRLDGIEKLFESQANDAVAQTPVIATKANRDLQTGNAAAVHVDPVATTSTDTGLPSGTKASSTQRGPTVKKNTRSVKTRKESDDSVKEVPVEAKRAAPRKKTKEPAVEDIKELSKDDVNAASNAPEVSKKRRRIGRTQKQGYVEEIVQDMDTLSDVMASDAKVQQNVKKSGQNKGIVKDTAANIDGPSERSDVNILPSRNVRNKVKANTKDAPATSKDGADTPTINVVVSQNEDNAEVGSITGRTLRGRKAQPEPDPAPRTRRQPVVRFNTSPEPKVQDQAVQAVEEEEEIVAPTRRLPRRRQELALVEPEEPKRSRGQATPVAPKPPRPAVGSQIPEEINAVAVPTEAKEEAGVSTGRVLRGRNQSVLPEQPKRSNRLRTPVLRYNPAPVLRSSKVETSIEIHSTQKGNRKTTATVPSTPTSSKQPKRQTRNAKAIASYAAAMTEQLMQEPVQETVAAIEVSKSKGQRGAQRTNGKPSSNAVLPETNDEPLTKRLRSRK